MQKSIRHNKSLQLAGLTQRFKASVSIKVVTNKPEKHKEFVRYVFKRAGCTNEKPAKSPSKPYRVKMHNNKFFERFLRWLRNGHKRAPFKQLDPSNQAIVAAFFERCVKLVESYRNKTINELKQEKAEKEAAAQAKAGEEYAAELVSLTG
jgi:hypothetical protein